MSYPFGTKHTVFHLEAHVASQPLADHARPPEEAGAAARQLRQIESECLASALVTSKRQLRSARLTAAL